MNTRTIAVLGALVLGVFMVRYFVLARSSSGPQGAPGAAAAHFTSFDEAMAKATEEKKVLVVDAMATWCGPCKMMDRDSWSNAEVQAWMGENAVFAQIDVDQHADTAKSLGIQAMPTVILFVDGKESKRVVGYRNAGQLLEWLKGA